MVRPLIVAVIALVACGRGPITNLTLAWRGVDEVITPSPEVATALDAVPIGFMLRDIRLDPTVVGLHEDTHSVVRTTDNVARYCSERMGDLLRRAGATFEDQPTVTLAADLIEYRVDEGGTFKGLVRVRVTVRRAGAPDWSQIFSGKSSRWGRSHSPENFNEALSNALADVVGQLVLNDGFARALLRPPAPEA